MQCKDDRITGTFKIKKMENKTFNSAESLELITRMIAETRGKLERGGGTTFLIWGYLSVAVSALVYILLNLTGNHQFQWLWFLIPAIGAPITFIYNRNRTRSVKTQIDRFIDYIWITVGIIEVMTPFFSKQIFMTEALVLNIGVILTGALLSFRPLVIGGIIGVLLSYSLGIIEGSDQIIIFAAMFAVTMVIPGHILNYRGRCLKN